MSEGPRRSASLRSVDGIRAPYGHARIVLGHGIHRDCHMVNVGPSILRIGGGVAPIPGKLPRIELVQVNYADIGQLGCPRYPVGHHPRHVHVPSLCEPHDRQRRIQSVGMVPKAPHATERIVVDVAVLVEAVSDVLEHSLERPGSQSLVLAPCRVSQLADSAIRHLVVPSSSSGVGKPRLDVPAVKLPSVVVHDCTLLVGHSRLESELRIPDSFRRIERQIVERGPSTWRMSCPPA